MGEKPTNNFSGDGHIFGFPRYRLWACTWWRLFQKHTVCTKLDIYVFYYIDIVNSSDHIDNIHYDTLLCSLNFYRTFWFNLSILVWSMLLVFPVICVVFFSCLYPMCIWVVLLEWHFGFRFSLMFISCLGKTNHSTFDNFMCLICLMIKQKCKCIYPVSHLHWIKVGC